MLLVLEYVFVKAMDHCHVHCCELHETVNLQCNAVLNVNSNNNDNHENK